MSRGLGDVYKRQHLSIDGHQGCFHLLGIANSTAMNRCAQISLSDLTLICIGFVLRSGIAGSYMVVQFLISKGTFVLFFYSSCTIL